VRLAKVAYQGDEPMRTIFILFPVANIVHQAPKYLSSKMLQGSGASTILPPYLPCNPFM